jgi:hypothetical protein
MKKKGPFMISRWYTGILGCWGSLFCTYIEIKGRNTSKDERNFICWEVKEKAAQRGVLRDLESGSSPNRVGHQIYRFLLPMGRVCFSTKILVWIGVFWKETGPFLPANRHLWGIHGPPAVTLQVVRCIGSWSCVMCTFALLSPQR